MPSSYAKNAKTEHPALKTYRDVVASLKPSSANLVEALETNDLAAIRDYVEAQKAKGEPVNLCWFLGYPVSHGNLPFFKYVLEHSAPPETPEVAEKLERDLLFNAAQRGHLHIIHHICKSNPAMSPEVINKAVHAAIEKDHLHILKYLDKKHPLRPTPVLEAIYRGHLRIVRYFMQYEENEQILRSAIHIAVQNGHLPVVRYLHEECGLPMPDRFSLGKIDVKPGTDAAFFDYMAEKGISLGVPDPRKMGEIVQNNRCDILSRLHKYGADITKIDPLEVQTAAFVGGLEIVEYLINNGWQRGTALESSIRDILDSDIPDKHLHIALKIAQSSAPDSDGPPYMLRAIEARKLWRKVRGAPAPDMAIEKFSPYLFQPKAYDDINAIIQSEGYGYHGHGYAYQAAGLFKTTGRVMDYLKKWGKPGKQPLHNIIHDIELPQAGRFNVSAWADAVLRHGPKMAKLVKFAGDFPEPMKDAKGQWSYRLTRQAVATKVYAKGHEHPELAELCFQFAWKEEDFEEALTLVKIFEKASVRNPAAKPGQNIPKVDIDGALFGKPDYRFYKLAPGDVRGLVLGEFTDCCQHLSGHGSDCAEHGFSSPHGGFYVLANTKTDQIVAQSWAWRGKKGELVLDSLESLPGHMNAQQWQGLCAAFAQQAGAENNIKALRIGTGGATPALPYPETRKPAKPLDYDGYRDSSQQYEVPLTPR